MSKSKQGSAESARNYSVEQEAWLIENVTEENPMTLEWAKSLEGPEDLNHGYRSIISKVQSLQLPYRKQEPAPKRPIPVTKSEVVKAISEEYGGVKLTGLEKATMSALEALCGAISVSIPERAES
jgi:hypothetical protein